MLAGSGVEVQRREDHLADRDAVVEPGPGHGEAQQQGPPPGEPLSGVAGLGVGKTATFPLTLTPGNYALICFIPDAKDGKPHFVHGMIQNFKV